MTTFLNDIFDATKHCTLNYYLRKMNINVVPSAGKRPLDTIEVCQNMAEYGRMWLNSATSRSAPWSYFDGSFIR